MTTVKILARGGGNHRGDDIWNILVTCDVRARFRSAARPQSPLRKPARTASTCPLSARHANRRIKPMCASPTCRWCTDLIFVFHDLFLLGSMREAYAVLRTPRHARVRSFRPLASTSSPDSPAGPAFGGATRGRNEVARMGSRCPNGGRPQAPGDMLKSMWDHPYRYPATPQACPEGGGHGHLLVTLLEGDLDILQLTCPRARTPAYDIGQGWAAA